MNLLHAHRVRQHMLSRLFLDGAPATARVLYTDYVHTCKRLTREEALREHLDLCLHWRGALEQSPEAGFVKLATPSQLFELLCEQPGLEREALRLLNAAGSGLTMVQAREGLSTLHAQVRRARPHGPLPHPLAQLQALELEGIDAMPRLGALAALRAEVLEHTGLSVDVVVRDEPSEHRIHLTLLLSSGCTRAELLHIDQAVARACMRQGWRGSPQFVLTPERHVPHQLIEQRYLIADDHTHQLRCPHCGRVPTGLLACEGQICLSHLDPQLRCEGSYQPAEVGLWHAYASGEEVAHARRVAGLIELRSSAGAITTTSTGEQRARWASYLGRASALSPQDELARLRWRLATARAA